MSDDRHQFGDDPVLDDHAAEWGVEPVLALLGDAGEPPPAALRAGVVGRARAVRRQLAEPVEPTALYASRVRDLRRLLESLSVRDWTRRAHPYEWTVHGLVAHLLVIERYTATQFGIDTPDVDGVDGLDDTHLELGATTIAHELERDPEVTAAAWAVAARRVVDLVGSDAYRPDRPARLHGWPFSQSSALVARAFELWTHADDIRRAVGRDPMPPAAGELRTMSSFSVQGLPFLVQLHHPGAQVVPVRVVLTGSGGGTYDIGGEGEPVARLAVDVIDYCRVVAGRLEPSQLEAERAGDRHVLDALLAAASLFAV